MTKVPIISLNGSSAGEAELPEQFNEACRPDLVRRAVHAEQSRRFQPKGNYVYAGMENTAEYYGRRHGWRQTINTGRSRLPREKLPGGRLGRVLRVPQAAKGRRAHPPKPWKRIIERINLKERNFAIRSAISATTNLQEVKKRGHEFEGSLPLVVENGLEQISKSKDALIAFEKLGLKKDLQRARDRRRMRSGRSRLRKGGYRSPKSVLVVIGEDKGIWKAARNFPGVDVVKVNELSAETLAPGGHLGRLTVWTSNAVSQLEKYSLFM
ncbi:50S ribosomal protein L4 [Candidatus Micrarchaeota archaeon]|nr:50S ribosomal protein L4 [Candidatus Micrarchaeota archaeon]